jgi:hypothetical protein
LGKNLGGCGDYQQQPRERVSAHFRLKKTSAEPVKA